MYLDVPIASSFCGSLILAISHYGEQNLFLFPRNTRAIIRFRKTQNRILGTITRLFIHRDVGIVIVILQRNDVRHA